METCTVALRGAIDIATVAKCKRLINEAIAGNPAGMVVVDLAKVTFLDSTGIGMLVGVHRRLTQFGGSIRLVHAQRGVQRVLEVTGVASILLDGAPPHSPGSPRVMAGGTG